MSNALNVLVIVSLVYFGWRRGRSKAISQLIAAHSDAHAQASAESMSVAHAAVDLGGIHLHELDGARYGALGSDGAYRTDGTDELSYDRSAARHLPDARRVVQHADRGSDFGGAAPVLRRRVLRDSAVEVVRERSRDFDDSEEHL